MKKILKIVLLTPIALAVAALLILSVMYSPTYVYRLITMNVADVYDYQHFENRVIKKSDDAFRFEKQLKEPRVESLFQDIVERSGFDNFEEWAVKSQTTALIMIRRDTILYERYFNGFSRDSYFHSQSVAKSFISFLIGAAIDDGLIDGVDDPITKYVPELKDRDPHFEKITIKNLLEMRSGLDYNTGKIPGTHIHAPWNSEAVGYYHPRVRKLLLEKVDIAREPGESYQYNNYNASYLGLIIERATGGTVSAYLEKKLWSQIMEYDALFSIDSKKSGFEYMPSRLIARAIDYARFGRLFLNKGNWNGKQIIPEAWVEASTRQDITINRNIYPEWYTMGCKSIYYSYQWWGHMNCDSTYQYMANGNLGQNIYVIPDEETIIVHCGNSLQHYSENDLWIVTERMKAGEGQQ